MGLFSFTLPQSQNTAITRLDSVDSRNGQVYVSVDTDADKKLHLLKCQVDLSASSIPCENLADLYGSNLLFQSAQYFVIIAPDRTAELYSLDDPTKLISKTTSGFVVENSEAYRADGNS